MSCRPWYVPISNLPYHNRYFIHASRISGLKHTCKTWLSMGCWMNKRLLRCRVSDLWLVMEEGWASIHRKVKKFKNSVIWHKPQQNRQYKIYEEAFNLKYKKKKNFYMEFSNNNKLMHSTVPEGKKLLWCWKSYWMKLPSHGSCRREVPHCYCCPWDSLSSSWTSHKKYLRHSETDSSHTKHSSRAETLLTLTDCSSYQTADLYL